MATNLMRFEDQGWSQGAWYRDTYYAAGDYPTISALIEGEKQTGARCAKNLFLKSQSPAALPQSLATGWIWSRDKAFDLGEQIT